ncbi:hypothetical protein DESC_600015 [Desulfosarcina cetonica]|nr:hypothetical protein DESC_600015 [Desulfosarcina cetonica]
MHDDVVGFDAKALSGVSPAEGALVVGASHGHLQKNTVSLAGGTDDVAFVMHTGPFVDSAMPPLAVKANDSRGISSGRVSVHLNNKLKLRILVSVVNHLSR